MVDTMLPGTPFVGWDVALSRRVGPRNTVICAPTWKPLAMDPGLLIVDSLHGVVLCSLFHWCMSPQCSCICCNEQHIYPHSLPSTRSLHRIPFICGWPNAGLGASVAGGNGNCCNALGLGINPLIWATSCLILSHVTLPSPWGFLYGFFDLIGFLGIKCPSIWLGNMAYWHFLQTLYSGKWIKNLSKFQVRDSALSFSPLQPTFNICFYSSSSLPFYFVFFASCLMLISGC